MVVSERKQSKVLVVSSLSLVVTGNRIDVVNAQAGN